MLNWYEDSPLIHGQNCPLPALSSKVAHYKAKTSKLQKCVLATKRHKKHRKLFLNLCLLCLFVATQCMSKASSAVSIPVGRKLSSCPSRKISTSVAPSS